MNVVREERDFAASARRAIGARSRPRRLELGEEDGRSGDGSSASSFLL